MGYRLKAAKRLKTNVLLCFFAAMLVSPILRIPL